MGPARTSRSRIASAFVEVKYTEQDRNSARLTDSQRDTIPQLTHADIDVFFLVGTADDFLLRRSWID